MIEVQLWQLVRDWVHRRYRRIRVIKFSTSQNLGKVVVKMSDSYTHDVGFVASKVVLLWPRSDEVEKYKDYVIIKATDKDMFKKIDAILREYEPKRAK